MPAHVLPLRRGELKKQDSTAATKNCGFKKSTLLVYKYLFRPKIRPIKSNTEFQFVYFCFAVLESSRGKIAAFIGVKI